MLECNDKKKLRTLHGGNPPTHIRVVEAEVRGRIVGGCGPNHATFDPRYPLNITEPVMHAQADHRLIKQPLSVGI